jgi:NitT/TauT family transport system ATP-binding protein
MTAVMAPRPDVEAARGIEAEGRPARPTDGAPAIRLVGTSKAFGRGPERVVALEQVTLDVQPGEFVCLVGASGCGKSTLLNLVCGLDAPTSGRVELPRGDRPTLIFQEAALFPWLTASENVELPMRLRGVGREERRRAATELLDRVQLGDAVRKRPHELSGGMRQRVALARALAHEADILCMDEPFGALDAMTRDLLHDELERLWRDTNLTILFVTHNVREAVRLGDRVVLLSSRPGRVVAEFPVEIRRPRRIESPEVSQMAIDIRDRLSDEVRRHGAG